MLRSNSALSIIAWKANQATKIRVSQVVLVVKNLPASTRDIRVQSLAQKDPLEEGTATHSSTPESHGQRSLGAAVRGVTKSQTWLKWLSTAKIKREWQRDQSMWSVCGWGWGDVRKSEHQKLNYIMNALLFSYVLPIWWKMLSCESYLYWGWSWLNGIKENRFCFSLSWV